MITHALDLEILYTCLPIVNCVSIFK